jgi:hypothetical protein
MFSSEDVLLSAFTDVFQLLQTRLASEASLDELELFLEEAFALISVKAAESGLVF